MFNETKMNLKSICADPSHNSRRENYTENCEPIRELMGTIRAMQGIFNPLIVIATPTDKDGNPVNPQPYTLIAGFRRYASLVQLASEDKDDSWLDDVPVKVYDSADEAEQVALQIIENAGRTQYETMELAEALDFMRGTNEPKLTEKQLAAKTGLSATTIKEHLAMLTLDDEIQVLLDTPVDQGGLPFSHAKLLTHKRIPVDQRTKLARMACGLTVAEFKKKLDTMFKPAEDAASTKAEDAADSESQKLARSVRMKKVEVDYLPWLKEKLAATPETDTTERLRLQGMVDALSWAVNPEKVASVSQIFLPFEEAKAAKEKKEAEEAEDEKTYKTYVSSLLKVVRETINVKVAPGETRPSVEQGFANVLATVKKNVEENTIPIDIFVGGLEGEEAINTFVTKDVKNAWDEAVKKATERKAAAEKKREEEAAKKAAEEAKKAAETEPAAAQS